MWQGSSDANEQTEREDAVSTAGFTEEFVMPEQGGGVTQVLSSCPAVQSAGQSSISGPEQSAMRAVEFCNGNVRAGKQSQPAEGISTRLKQKAESWGSSFSRRQLCTARTARIGALS